MRWQAALDKCKAVWKELRGVPLLPLANGTAGSFPSSFLLGGGGRQRFILGTRRQQGLLPQLKGRFVHLKATRRLARFFERDEFLEVGVAFGYSDNLVGSLTWGGIVGSFINGSFVDACSRVGMAVDSLVDGLVDSSLVGTVIVGMDGCWRKHDNVNDTLWKVYLPLHPFFLNEAWCHRCAHVVLIVGFLGVWLV